jgi:hypothetical protein
MAACKGDVKHLARNQLLHFFRQRSTPTLGLITVHDTRQRVDFIAVDQHVELHQFRAFKARETRNPVRQNLG